MRKVELAAKVAAEIGQSSALVARSLDEFIKYAFARLAAGTPLEVKQFGCFDVITEPSREVGTVLVPAKRLPAFTSVAPVTEATAEVNETVVQLVATASQISPELMALILNHAFTAVKATLLSGERVTIESFGTFEIMVLPSRTLTDPDTGETITSQEKRGIRFNSSKDLKVAVAGDATVGPIQS